MKTKMLEFSSVSKSYGTTMALKQLDFAVSHGESIALLGSNGAGKSTFMNLASGLRRPDCGEVRVFGHEPGSLKSQSHMRVLPQELAFPAQLKVKEILQLVAGHYESFDFSELVGDLEMTHLLNRKVSALSGGEGKRVGLICTLIGNPDLVLLDEPTSNIDLQGRRLVYDVLLKFLQKKTSGRSLLFSSHQMQEVEFLADKIFVLKAGEIVVSGSTSEIKSQWGLKKVKFKSSNFNGKFESAKIVETKGERVTLLGKCSDSMLREVIGRDISACEIQVSEPSLDEIFLKIWNGKG